MTKNDLWVKSIISNGGDFSLSKQNQCGEVMMQLCVAQRFYRIDLSDKFSTMGINAVSLGKF